MLWFSQSNGGCPDREPARTGTPRFVSRSATLRPVLPAPPTTSVVLFFWMLFIPVSSFTWMFDTGWCILDNVNIVLPPVGDPADEALHFLRMMASEQGMAGAKLFEIPREQVSERYEILHLSGGGLTTAVCGLFQFDRAAHHLITLCRE